MVRFSLILSVLLTIAAAIAGKAAAATIDVNNTARLELRLAGATRSIASNTVTTEVVPPPTPAKVTFLRAAPSGSNGVAMATDGTLCRLGSGGFAPAPAMNLTTGQRAMSATGLMETRTYHAGEPIVISLADGNRNRDPSTRDTVEVRITSTTGDEEVVRLMETEANSGVFAGVIPSVGMPPEPVLLDCKLSLNGNAMIRVAYTDSFYPTDVAEASILVDPFGIIFNSETGEPINGVTITLINEATGQPASVFGDDGLSSYPSTVVSGGTATDASGALYTFPAGGYRFPLVAPGRYRLVIMPAPGLAFPSTALPEDLARLGMPNGEPYVIDASASFGGSFPVVDGPPFRADLPLDSPRLAMLVKKAASVTEASIGDFVRYTVRVENRSPTLVRQAVALIDTMSAGLRYRKGSLRIDGRPAPDPSADATGRVLRFVAGDIPVRGSVELSYLAQVTPAARLGIATNRAEAELAGAPMSNAAQVGIRIKPLLMADAATIIGRVVEGDCDLAPKKAPGVAGVRILMEDGTFVVSDRDGLFHFEGVRPGNHVVQLDLSSLPEGYEAIPCIRNTRHGGRAFSQFVDLRGGALWRTDFHLRRTAAAPKADGQAVDALPEPVAPAAPTNDAAAAGGDRNWFAGQAAGNEWLFPSVDHNPRAPTVRAVVKHEAGTTVELSVNGERVSELAFDGTDESADRAIRISRWRGLPLGDGDTRLKAVVKAADGRTIATLDRVVHYANAVAHAVLVPERSKLVADGRTRAIVAVRLTDRAGRPVRQGVTGDFQLSAPYRVATDIDLQQARQLAGGDNATTYRVAGDDGIALIELAPTTQAGSIELTFTHTADQRRVVERLTGWMQPGDQPFVLVGFAAGTVGHEVLTEHAQRLDARSRKLTATDGQVSLFAKGRVRGKWLMTVAYDTDKATGRGARRPLGGTIDPQKYYTVYGDGTEQGYDAASTKKLYLRLERPQFYALFGDYETGLTQSQLARYSRSFTGVKTEYRGKTVAVNAFATETPFRYARDEIQGNGLSGLYRLSRRDIVLNSDKVRIETRDRFRSEVILRTTLLARHVDYDIDYAAGTLRFRRAVTSRDADLNPNFIVAEYETEGTAAKRTNAGGRVAATLAGGRIEAGGSLIHDEDGAAKSDLAGADLKVKVGTRTELRVEAARSRGKTPGAETSEGGAYLAEVEHRGAKLDALLYFRQQDIDFGVGQLNIGQGGTRKIGVDGRYRATDTLSLSGSAWREEALVGAAQREAGQALVEYRRDATALRAGIQVARDKLAAGTLDSRLLTLGASHGFFDNRLVLDADTALSLGSADSLDFPNRYRIGATYALQPDVKIVATHEISRGETVDTSTTSLGFDASPWTGARLASSVNQQAVREFGPRTFALYGLSQTVPLGERWSIDASIDGSRTLKGAIDADRVLDLNQPVSSGGFIGSGDRLSDDFWALSAGATYRSRTLSWTGRAEYRAGDLDDRIGVTTALLRQTQAGISFAASAQAFRTRQAGGATATLGVIDASIAYRPLGSRLAVLDKLELRIDAIKNGRGTTDGLLGADGLAAVGDAKSRRIINNLAVNLVSDHWNEENRHGPAAALQRTQASIYYGSKYVLDRYDGADVSGYTHLLGIEARHDLTEWLDIGFNAAARHVTSTDSFGYSFGPSVGVSPIANAWVSIGYNINGFEDRDFDDARYTRKGFFATLRFKFDQMSPADLFGRFARK